MSNKTYILQKDLPDIKAGAKGFVNENRLLCFYENESMGTPEYFFPIESYENNLEWFKLKEEKKFTETDMRICFESARLMTRCESAMCRVYKDFDEYLKLITE